jgi:hypothetical protein
MVKPAVLYAFYIVGSGLWRLWEVTYKIYEYVKVWYSSNYLYVS